MAFDQARGFLCHTYSMVVHTILNVLLWGHVTLKRTFYSRAARPGGHVDPVLSVWGDTVHRGTGSTPSKLHA